MTLEAHGDFDARAGRAACVCDGTLAGADDLGARETARLAASFGLAVLAQALALMALPEASRLIAPRVDMIGWPFALALLGAALASLPAAFLADAFGRRAIVALGASLGVAGGALSVFAVARGNFPLLCLGAFWLGTTQGFGLYYRHIAALSSRLGARGGSAVLAGGAFAALLAPAMVTLGARVAGEGPSGPLLGAVALHILGLALAARLPPAAPEQALRESAAEPFAWGGSNFLLACFGGGIAWFAMSATMLHGPGALARCEAAPLFIGGAMAWHLLAMYAPTAVAAWRPALFPPRETLFAGVALAVLAAASLSRAASLEGATTALLLVGVGWSLANIAGLRLLHDSARPPRVALALHDLILLAAATAGALARMGLSGPY